MKLLQDRILVSPITSEETKNGIIIPQTAQQKNTGKVLIVSDKCEVVKIGDTVKYHNHAGVHIKHNNTDCLIMKESIDIIAIL